MANEIKGLTVEISGDVRPLTSALKEAEAPSKEVQAELKSINAALKLDPSNIVLLTQKQKLLGQQTEAVKKKMDVLTLAKEQAEKALADGNGSEEALRAIQREIAFVESKLKRLESQSKTTDEKLLSAGESGKDGMDKTGSAADGAKKKVKDVGDAADGASGKVSSFGDVLKGSLAADAIKSAAEAAIDAIGEIGERVTESLDTVGDLDDNAQKVGMSAEALQEWQYAAKMSGLESETLVKALEKQQKSFADAKSGSASLVETYKALGVNLDGLRTSEEALDQVIDALSDLEDETERDALANDIFGKSYAELAPLFNHGSEQIKQYRQQAHELGLVLDNETVQAFAETGDAVDTLSSLVDTTQSRIVAGMLPALKETASVLQAKLNAPATQRELEKLGKSAGKLISSATELGLKLLPKLADAMAFISRNGKTLAVTAAALVVAFKGFSIVNTAKTAVAGLTTKIRGLNTAIASNPIGLFLTALASLIAIIAAAKMANDELNASIRDTYKDSIEAANAAAESRKQLGQSMDDERDHVNDLLTELDDLVESSGKVKESQEARVEYILGELSAATGEEILMVDGVIQKYDELTDAIHNSLMMRQAEDWLNNTQTDYETAKTQIGSLEKDEDGNYVGGSLAAVEDYRQGVALLREYVALQQEQVDNGGYASAELDAKREELIAYAEETGHDEFDPTNLLGYKSIAEMRDILNSAEKAYTEALSLYDNNVSLAGQYEAVQEGVWAQDVEATTSALETAKKGFLEAETASMASLVQQRDAAIADFQTYKEWAAEDGSAVTQGQLVESANDALTAAQEVLDWINLNPGNYNNAQLQTAITSVQEMSDELLRLTEGADFLSTRADDYPNIFPGFEYNPLRRTATALIGGWYAADGEYQGYSSAAQSGSSNPSVTSADISEISAHLTEIERRIEAIDPTLVLDDGTLIAKTDTALGRIASRGKRSAFAVNEEYIY